MYSYLYNLAFKKEKGIFIEVLKFFLFLLSLIYGLIVVILTFYYKFRAYKLNCKVISVGNITLGGTGKTPFVQALAKYLHHNKHRVAILTRGYKGKSKINPPSLKLRRVVRRNEVKADKNQKSKTNYQFIGDEAYLLRKNLPEVAVLVGRNRIRNGKEAIEKYKVDTILLDDGFQHWRLYRDLDIVLIDATNPFGNGYLIPRGILRESLNSLKRADLIILTKVGFIRGGLLEILDKLKMANPYAKIYKAIYEPYELIDISGRRYPLSFIREKDICLLCGVASPTVFKKSIENLGANVKLEFIFFDHYSYRKEDIEKIIDSCTQEDIKIIATTEKDAVRLELFHKELEPFVFILRSKIKIIQDEEGFFKRIATLYKH